MSLSIYNFALYFYYFIILCYSRVNKKAKLWHDGRVETQRLVKNQELSQFRGAILCHAASLGEFEQLRPLIEKIKQNYPEQKIVVSFFSPSGYEVRKNYALADKVLYLPYDFPSQINAFLKQLSPKAFIIVRYEFWINTISCAYDLKIPTYLISASFRPQQIFFKSYGHLYKKLLQYYANIFVTRTESIALLKTIGIEKVKLAPDTRIDRVVAIASQSKEIAEVSMFLENKSCCLVAGSTWEKDLAVILPYLHQHPNNKYVIAPHHIDEKSIIEIESKLTIPNIRFSKLSGNFVEGINVLIIDNFGMLASLYKYGKYAYVGGGFGTSVHNVLEASVYGKPVFFGPNYKKAQECIDLIEQKAAFCVITSNSFSQHLDQLESSSESYETIAINAKKYIESNQGGTEIIYQNIVALLA